MPFPFIHFRPFVILIFHQQGIVGDRNSLFAIFRLLVDGNRHGEILHDDALDTRFFKAFALAGLRMGLALFGQALGQYPAAPGLGRDKQQGHQVAFYVKWNSTNSMHGNHRFAFATEYPCRTILQLGSFVAGFNTSRGGYLIVVAVIAT